jgi:hypothetical protein
MNPRHSHKLLKGSSSGPASAGPLLRPEPGATELGMPMAAPKSLRNSADVRARYPHVPITATLVALAQISDSLAIAHVL